jgi:hypothetical protein
VFGWVQSLEEDGQVRAGAAVLTFWSDACRGRKQRLASGVGQIIPMRFICVLRRRTY